MTFLFDTIYLVNITNEDAIIMLVQCRSISTWWQDVTVEEMKAFVGVIINMGILKLTNTRSTGLPPSNYQLFIVFSRDRCFKQICWMLHVGDLTATTIFG